MKKFFQVVIIGCFVSLAVTNIYAQNVSVTDDQIRGAAQMLGIPFNELKALVQRHNPTEVVVNGTEWVYVMRYVDFSSGTPRNASRTLTIRFIDNTRVTVTNSEVPTPINGTYRVNGHTVIMTTSDGGRMDWRIEGNILHFDNETTFTKVR